MRHVRTILWHILNVAVDQKLVLAVVRPPAILDLLHDTERPRCRVRIGVVPYEDEPVRLERLPLAQPGHLRYRTGSAVRDVGALPVLSAERPVVERTLDAVTPDDTANTEVRPEMGTVGIEDVHGTGERPEDGQVLAETVDGPGAARSELLRFQHREPTVRVGRRDAVTDLAEPAGPIHAVHPPPIVPPDAGRIQDVVVPDVRQIALPDDRLIVEPVKGVTEDQQQQRAGNTTPGHNDAR
uniref:Putative secreted protein n=1 Tax=Anopheles darlingi TaxID=43151 RepID=A0A2M4D1Y4_ANODA